MNEDVLNVEIILKRQKYSKIYNIGFIILIIFFIFLYVVFTYKYQTYCIFKAKNVNHKLEILVSIDDIKYIKDNTTIQINDTVYDYIIDNIDNELYVDEYYNNYMYVYLNVDNLDTNLENYIYEVKIPKENQIIAKYLKKYL